MGELSKIVWKEGGEVRSIQGDLVESDDPGFVSIKTLRKVYHINRKDIIKIEEVQE